MRVAKPSCFGSCLLATPRRLPRHSVSGIDTLTAAVGRNAPHHGSGNNAALPPDSKRLGPKRLEDAALQQVALDIERVLDSGVDRQEALG